MSDNNKNIEEMMKQVTEESSDEIIDVEDDKQDLPIKKIAISVVAVIVLLIGLFFVLRPKRNPDNVGKDKEIYDNEVKEVVGKSESMNYPIDVPEWARTRYTDEFFEDEKRVQDMLTWVSEVGFEGYLVGQVSPKDDFVDDIEVTNDVEKRFLEDGTENPGYYYTLREDYMSTFALVTQRLLNPVFGNWTMYQYSSENMPAKENILTGEFDDMFDDEWWGSFVDKATQENDYSEVPIYADWNNDDYGGIKFSESKDSDYGRYFGEIDESPERLMEVEQVESVDEKSESVKVSYNVKLPIKYTALTKGDTKDEVKGWLEFTLSSNDNAEEVDYRVKASNVKLVIE